MPTIQINRAHIDFVIRQVIEPLRQHPTLHPVEVVLALSEATGRVIAIQEGTHLVHNELIDTATDHIRRTVRAAYSAKGNNPEAISGS